MAKDNYTFGDSDQASVRLRRLADLYEPETRELFRQSGVYGPKLAVDLGCGPGYSTRLIQEALRPDRTVGLDTSERYVTVARQNQNSGVEFHVHNVARVPFPVSSPNLLFCRFLLTHLSSLGSVLGSWASIAAPGAVLLIHETETLETEHPALLRYYDLVGQLQRHYGQTLLVGAVLNDCLQNTGWNLMESHRRVLEKDARDMAELHVANLRTWRHDPYAASVFDFAEVDGLEISLERIANGAEDAGVVVNAARQIIAKRQ